MPNWVYNTLSATGSVVRINKLQEQLNRPVTETNDDNCIESLRLNPVFSLWNIISPDDNMFKKWNEIWYTWSIENWGCKWDACECDVYDIERDDGKQVTYSFNTPWDPPNEAIINISKQYEDIEFTLVYEEETGWGGEDEIINGVVTLVNQYNWRCSNCDFNTMNDVEYCEDCESCPCPNCGSTETDTTCDAHTKDSNEE